jgi:peptidyl-prolyl cis-trans isomerase C
VARALALAAALAATLPGTAPRAAEHGVAARVNGAVITRERLEQYFDVRMQESGRNVAAIRSPNAFKALKQEALDELVDRELLWQEAKRLGHVASRDEVDAAMSRFRKAYADPARRRVELERGGFTEESYAEYVRRELSIRRLVARDVAPRVRVGAAEVSAFYEENRDRLFSAPPEVRARHVLVKNAPDAAPDARAEALRRIEAVLTAARGGADLGDLARRYSEDSTAAAGGDLGWFPPGWMVPAFDAAAFSLAPGELSSVVETPFGFHVVEVQERRPAIARAEEEVRDEVRAHLRERRLGEAVAERVAKLRRSARIEVEIPLEEGT